MEPFELASEAKSLLSNKLDESMIKDFTESLEENAKKILSESVCTIKVINESKQAISNVIDELTSKELVQKDISPLQRALEKLLRKYTSDQVIIDNIKKQALEFIANDFRDSRYPYHIVDDALRNFIFEEVYYQIKNPLKEVNNKVFFFDFVEFLTVYADFIHDVTDKFDRQIREPLEQKFDDTISPAQDLITQQAVLADFHERDLFYELFQQITEIRHDLVPVKLEYFDAKLEDLPDGISQIEKEEYAQDAMIFAEQTCIEVEDNWMNAAIVSWFNPSKPPILASLLDFDRIKAKARDYAIHNEQVDAIESMRENLITKTQAIYSNDRQLSEKELDSFAGCLSDFLNQALEKNLNFLLTPEVQIRLNPDNKRFFLNAYNYKELFEILPAQLKKAVLTQETPFTAKQVKELGLTTWHEPQNILQGIADFISNKQVLQDAESFLKWHNEKVINHLVKKNNEYLSQQENIRHALAESPKAEEIDDAKIKLLMNEMQKDNLKIFQLFAKKVNLPTAKATVEAIRKAYTLQNVNLPSQPHNYVKALMQQINLLDQPSNPGNTSIFKKPMDSEYKSKALNMTDEVVKDVEQRLVAVGGKRMR